MRIGIDARLYGSLGGGLGRYTSELLAELEQQDTDNEYVVFLRDDNFDEYQPKAKNFKKIRAEFPWYGWKEQVLMGPWLQKFNLDLMHFTHFNVPYFYGKPFVVTVHDLILFSHPTPRASTLSPLLYRLKYLLYKLVITKAVKKAKRVITVSKFSRQEILRQFKFLKPEDVSVTYEACSQLLPTEEKEIDQKVPTPFMMYVGNAYPHKNLDRLVSAFQDFRGRGFDEWNLVLVGKKNYFYQRLEEETKTKNLDENITFFGRASDEELASLYSQADFYIFPSLCEGFGLPPLEAMRAGLPVTAAASSCLPEILNGAADWFSPTDKRDMVSAMTRMASDNVLRFSLAERGLERVAEFSWSRCAQETLDIYNQVIG